VSSTTARQRHREARRLGTRRAHRHAAAGHSGADEVDPGARRLVACAELALLDDDVAGRVGCEGHRARRGSGGVHRRGLAGRVQARRVADRLATLGDAAAIQARQLGVGEGPTVLDGHERQQGLDGRQAPDPRAVAHEQRPRADGQARRVRVRVGVVAMRQCRAQHRPAAVDRERSAAMDGRRRPRDVLVAEDEEAQATRARVALWIAEQQLEVAEDLAIERGAQRRQGARGTLHAIDRAQQLRRRGVRRARLPGHVERRRRGHRAAAGGRDDHEAAVGLRRHVDALGARAKVQDHAPWTLRGHRGDAQHSVRRRMAPAQRDRLARLQGLRAGEPRDAGSGRVAAFRGAEAQVGLCRAVRRVAGQGDDVVAAGIAALRRQLGPGERRRAGGWRERQPDEGADDQPHQVGVMPANGRPYPLRGYRPAQCAPSS
jgi:hypothetical protein